MPNENDVIDLANIKKMQAIFNDDENASILSGSDSNSFNTNDSNINNEKIKEGNAKKAERALKNAEFGKGSRINVNDLIALSKQDNEVDTPITEDELNARNRNFAFVWYPSDKNVFDKEQARIEYDVFLSSLSSLKLQGFSILHDSDYTLNKNNEIVTNEDGEPVPARIHAHVLLYFEGKKSLLQVAEIISKINVKPTFEVVGNRLGYARYMTHKDQHWKHAYDNDEVCCLGGLDYTDFIESGNDAQLMLQEIEYIINEFNIYMYRTLMDTLKKVKPTHYRLLINNNSYRNHILSYMKSKRYDEQQLLTITNDDERVSVADLIAESILNEDDNLKENIAKFNNDVYVRNETLKTLNGVSVKVDKED